MKPVRPIKARNTRRVATTLIAQGRINRLLDRESPESPSDAIFAMEAKELINGLPDLRIRAPGRRSRGCHGGILWGSLVRFALWLLHWQHDGGRRALAEFACDLEPALVQAGKPLHDRQAEAGAVMAAIIGVVRLDEGMAELRQVVLGNADSVVGDDELDPAVSFPRRDTHQPSGFGELDRVRDHVEQHLLAGPLVGDELGQT